MQLQGFEVRACASRAKVAGRYPLAALKTFLVVGLASALAAGTHAAPKKPASRVAPPAPAGTSAEQTPAAARTAVAALSRTLAATTTAADAGADSAARVAGTAPGGEITGTTWTGSPAVTETVEKIMQRSEEMERLN